MAWTIIHNNQFRGSGSNAGEQEELINHYLFGNPMADIRTPLYHLRTFPDIDKRTNT
jgi:hypothetical protein